MRQSHYPKNPDRKSRSTLYPSLKEARCYQNLHLSILELLKLLGIFETQFQRPHHLLV